MYNVELSHPLLWNGRVEIPSADIHARGQPFTGRGLRERDIGCGDMDVGILMQEGEWPDCCACG